MVNQGDKVTGTFSLAPNKKNERDLDITINYDFKGNDQNVSEKLEYRMC
jgi:protein arginine N-methyltransferase 1